MVKVTSRTRAVVFLLILLIVIPVRGTRADHYWAPKGFGSSHEPERAHRKNRDSDFWWFMLLIGLGVGVAATPFVAPPLLIGDDYTRSGYFPSYPYQGEAPGYLMIKPWFPAEPYTWSLRPRLEYMDNLEATSGVGGQLLFETTSRFGIDTEASYREKTRAGFEDELWLGDANLVFRFAQSPRVEMRTGLGINWSSKKVQPGLGSPWGRKNTERDTGFNVTYGADWFPQSPWIVSAELDYGTLGSGRRFHVRNTVGVQLRSAELFFGFDHVDIRDREITSLVSGIRLWL